MKETQKKLGQYLPQAILTALTIFCLSFLLNPIASILEALLSGFANQTTILIILRLLVGLLIVIFALLAYILILHKKFHYKKRFRFGIYWKEYTPFCPHCGGKLYPADPAYLECELCEERLQMTDWGKTSIRLKDAVEELKKDKQ